MARTLIGLVLLATAVMLAILDGARAAGIAFSALLLYLGAVSSFLWIKRR